MWNSLILDCSQLLIWNNFATFSWRPKYFTFMLEVSYHSIKYLVTSIQSYSVYFSLSQCVEASTTRHSRHFGSGTRVRTGQYRWRYCAAALTTCTLFSSSVAISLTCDVLLPSSIVTWSAFEHQQPVSGGQFTLDAWCHWTIFSLRLLTIVRSTQKVGFRMFRKSLSL